MKVAARSKAAVRQPNLLGFELEDLKYFLGTITWLSVLKPFLLLAGLGARLFALLIVWEPIRPFPGGSGV